MSPLVLVAALEVGLLPNYGLVMYEPPAYVYAELPLYMQLEASVELHGFYVGGAVTVYMWKVKGGRTFSPYQLSSRFDAGWRNDWLTIGFRHLCEHPVIPHFNAGQAFWERAYEQLFVRVEGRIPLFTNARE